MAVKIKTNMLAGYECVAFSYRYLNTTLTPLSLMEAFHLSVPSGAKPGQWLVDTLYKEGFSPEHTTWLHELRSMRDADRTYRHLADEYYRQVDISNVTLMVEIKENVNA